eukprot:COSAG02_NODE_2412_length_8920_cov_2.506178_3_plen_102_part_00
MVLRARQSNGSWSGVLRVGKPASGDALLTEEQMKMSFMPLLYKLMYELSRSVYRATYTTAYLHANAGQGLCRGRARRCPSVCQQPPAHSLYQSRYLCHMSV